MFIPPPPPPKVPPPPAIFNENVVLPVKNRDKYKFSIPQLAEMYEVTYMAIKKRLDGVAPDGVIKGGAKVWDISRITFVTNDLNVSLQRKSTSSLDFHQEDHLSSLIEDDLSSDIPLPEENLGKMTPAQLKVYFQTLDIQQSYLNKKSANAVKSGELIPKEEVRKSFVLSFKIMAEYLDSLPDILERDGLLESDKVDRAIKSVDRIRTELANTMSNMAKEIETEL